MQVHAPLLSTIVVGIVLAFAFGAVAHRLKISPLVGYLLAGVTIGPFTPGFVGDQTVANVLFEIGVFARHDRLTENRGNAVVVDDDAPLRCELADFPAVTGEDPRNGVGLIRVERADLWEIVGVGEQHPADRTQQRGDQEQGDDTRPPRDFDGDASALRA